MSKKSDKKEVKKQFYKQCRNWAFTDFKLLDMNSLYHDNIDTIRYLCYGEEICPKTKKTHYQGWIQFVNKKTMGGVKRIFKSKCIHLEQMRSTELNNDKYCKKDNKFKTFGKYKCQGERTDLEAIKHDIEIGKPMINIAKDYFSDFIRYKSGFIKYRELHLKKTTKEFRNVNVVLKTGKTNTNKTRSAVENNPDAYKIQGHSMKWWDGYEGEKTIIIDEYNNDIGITQLLSILDGYQLRLPIKGGFIYANWTKVIITTNLRTLHSNAKEEHINALNRRINTIISTW